MCKCVCVCVCCHGYVTSTMIYVWGLSPYQCLSLPAIEVLVVTRDSRNDYSNEVPPPSLPPPDPAIQRDRSNRSSTCTPVTILPGVSARTRCSTPTTGRTSTRCGLVRAFHTTRPPIIGSSRSPACELEWCVS